MAFDRVAAAHACQASPWPASGLVWWNPPPKGGGSRVAVQQAHGAAGVGGPWSKARAAAPVSGNGC